MQTPHHPDQISVKVFHNLMFIQFSATRPYPGEYLAGDPIVQVFATTAPAGSDSCAVCEEVFHLLNVGDDPTFGTPDARAIAYRARGNRSLSVSDLVCVGDAWYACASTGFDPVPEPRIVSGGWAGSTPHTGVDLPESTGASAPAV
ncbi:hypothetical protein ACOZ38_28480 [Sphaerisporangium viridialbum]|uniref:hypothetical protein n=1 Tax=Sphaerisporangium viridialbum TaxID=46189 RepID=UPI003C71A82F